MNYVKVLLAILLFFKIVSCAGAAAFGRTEHYESAWPAITYSVNSRVNILVVDKRPYVLSKSKDPSFVGLMRGGFGNPFDIVTATKLPLARDIELAVENGLRNSGVSENIITATNENIHAGEDENSKLLTITVYEWKSDTFRTTRFSYDISADIYDHAGILLGTQRISNSAVVPSAIEAARQALNRLLTSEPVIRGLSANPE